MRLFLTTVLSACFASIASAQILIGVLAPQGDEVARKTWQPLVDYVSGQIGEPVELLPLDATEGVDAFAAEQIDFLLGNPVQTAVVTSTSGGEPLSSVMRMSGTQFAGLIISRADNPIEHVTDLEGRRIATLGNRAAGGYIFQADFVVRAGAPKPDQIATRLRGSNQRELVMMVLDGVADAAFIRTGVLEAMEADGILKISDLHVLNDQARLAQDLHRTTDWYPEWTMTAHPSADENTALMLKVALEQLHAKHPALVGTNVVGFVEALDVSPVIEAMKRVGVAPFGDG